MHNLSVCTLTVPGAVPSQSLRATSFEDRILLYWKEPTEPNGVIIQYEVRLAEAVGRVIVTGAKVSLCSVGNMYKPGFCLSVCLQISYSGLRSFDPSVPLQRPGLTVSLPSNATHHLFSQLHPGVTYQLSIRASTSKGFGPATTLNVTTNISGRKYATKMFILAHFYDITFTQLASVYMNINTDSCSFFSPNNRWVRWIRGLSEWNCNNYHCPAETCSGQGSTYKVLYACIRRSTVYITYSNTGMHTSLYWAYF